MKFNVLILNRLYFATILTKCFFPYLNSTSYLKDGHPVSSKVSHVDIDLKRMSRKKQQIKNLVNTSMQYIQIICIDIINHIKILLVIF